MTIQWTNLARLTAYLETKSAIDNKDEAKVLARSMHATAQGQLKLRDAEKWQAHKMQNVANTVQVVQSAVAVVNKAKEAGNEVQNLQDQANGVELSNQPRQIGQRAQPKSSEPTKPKTPEEKKAAIGDAIKAKIKSQMLEDLQKGAMERLEHAQKKAQERAARNEELAGQMRSVKSQVRDDAYDHLSEIRNLDAEDFTKQRNRS